MFEFISGVLMMVVIYSPLAYLTYRLLREGFILLAKGFVGFVTSGKEQLGWKSDGDFYIFNRHKYNSENLGTYGNIFYFSSIFAGLSTLLLSLMKHGEDCVNGVGYVFPSVYMWPYNLGVWSSDFIMLLIASVCVMYASRFVYTITDKVKTVTKKFNDHAENKEIHND